MVDLKNGPTEVRNCTDLFCCLIFSCFLLAVFAVTMHAFKYGNPHLLATPYDPDHKPCGEGKLKDYPFIYFTNPIDTSNLWKNVCVKECPTDKSTELECAVNTVVKSCKGIKAPAAVT